MIEPAIARLVERAVAHDRVITQAREAAEAKRHRRPSSAEAGERKPMSPLRR